MVINFKGRLFMRIKKSQSMILTQKLEGISKKIFEKYKKIIVQYIGNKPGVYALYDEKELYYVGLASDLARRVNAHLKDKHSALWTHFSVYFTKKEQYMNDIEAVIISIAQPKGNTVKPKLGKETKLKDFIKQAIKESHQAELMELGFSGKEKKQIVSKKQTISKKQSKNRPDLKNYFETERPLIKTYKGKTYKATLLTSGKIQYEDKIYNTPSAVAKEIAQKEMNGWTFWFIQDRSNNWVQLSELD